MSLRNGKSVTYQAEFTPEEVKSKVTLTLKDFKPVVRGVIQTDLPSLLEASQESKKIKIESLSFQVTRDSISEGRKSLEPITADLKIHDSNLGFGLVYGARYAEVRKMLLRMADLYQSLIDNPSFDSKGFWLPLDVTWLDMYSRGALRILGRYPQILRSMALLLDRMNTRMANFPELEPYKILKTRPQQTDFLNALAKKSLSPSPFRTPNEAFLSCPGTVRTKCA